MDGREKLNLEDSLTEMPQAQENGAPQARDRDLGHMIKDGGRAFSHALMTVAGTPQRSGRLWTICGATFIVIALLIIQVAYRHRELNLGYQLSEAISQRELLLEQNRKLRIELRVLSRRERLEPLAGKQFNMAPARPDQVVIVRDGALREGARKLKLAGGRRDGLDAAKRVGGEE